MTQQGKVLKFCDDLEIHNKGGVVHGTYHAHTTAMLKDV